MFARRVALFSLTPARLPAVPKPMDLARQSRLRAPACASALDIYHRPQGDLPADWKAQERSEGICPAAPHPAFDWKWFIEAQYDWIRADSRNP
jgi:hypothetical protein